MQRLCERATNPGFWLFPFSTGCAFSAFCRLYVWLQVVFPSLRMSSSNVREVYICHPCPAPPLQFGQSYPAYVHVAVFLYLSGRRTAAANGTQTTLAEPRYLAYVVHYQVDLGTYL